MTSVVAVIAALVVQRLLGLPPLPAWSAAMVVPMAIVVVPLIRGEQRSPIATAVLLGLAWDIVMEPVVGPGGIAWSATTVVLGVVATVVANRSVAAWAGFGAIGAGVLVAVHWLALLPLGLAPTLGATRLALAMSLTGAWCGLLGWVDAADLPSRWRRWRIRRLR